MQLFDEIERTDTGYPNHDESSFVFLNRSARTDVNCIRKVLQKWFDSFPEEKKADIHSKFRSDDERRHVSALLELATHAMLIANGAVVDAGHDEQQTPDFQATYQDTEIVVECTTVQKSDKDHGASSMQNSVLKAIDSLDTGRFRLGVSLLSAGSKQPSTRQICNEIKNWIATLDINEELQHSTEAFYRGRIYTWDKDGWQIEITAIPMPHQYDKDSLTGAIVAGANHTANISLEDHKLRGAVKEKAKQYHPKEKPYLVIIGAATHFAYGGNIENVLLGDVQASQPAGVGEIEGSLLSNSKGYGLFGTVSKPRYRHVSAILYKPALNIWTLCRAEKPWQLIRNPWAKNPLPDGLFPFAEGEDGEKRSINDVLGLPEDCMKWQDEE